MVSISRSGLPRGRLLAIRWDVHSSPSDRLSLTSSPHMTLLPSSPRPRPPCTQSWSPHDTGPWRARALGVCASSLPSRTHAGLGGLGLGGLLSSKKPRVLHLGGRVRGPSRPPSQVSELAPGGRRGEPPGQTEPLDETPSQPWGLGSSRSSWLFLACQGCAPGR